MNLKCVVIGFLALATPVSLAAEVKVPVEHESHWINLQRQQARSALRGLDADLLIIPVQGGQNTFDPIARSLITRLAADRIARNTDLVVSNPTLVFRELGSYRSTYPDQEIRDLAKISGAKEVLELHADHDRAGRFEFRANLVDGNSGLTIRSKVWPGLEYSDIRPPSIAVQDIFGELFEFVTGDKDSFRSSKRLMTWEEFQFPESVEELKSESKKSPAHSAAYLQLLAMLHPSGLFNETRNHLFERSLVQLSKVGADEPTKRYFTARAYAYLNRRPAAVHALDKPRTSYERALLAALDGNLQQLRDEVDDMAASPLDLMAWREVQEMERRYGDRRERDIVDRFASNYPGWAPFIYRALRDTNQWADYSAATIKLGLENLVPSDSTSLQTLLVKAEVLGERPDELELTRLVWRHTEAANEQHKGGGSQQSDNSLSVSELDILDLAQTIAVANQLRRVEDNLSKRKKADSALQNINKFESLFSGHPAVTLQKGRALKTLANDRDRAEQQTLQASAAVELLHGLAWTGQMTRDAADSARQYDGLLVTRQFGRVNDQETDYPFSEHPIRYFEWPMSTAWFNRMPREEFGNGILQSCIDYLWSSYYCLTAKIKYLEAQPSGSATLRSELLAKYGHRYLDDPQRAEFELASALASGDEDAEIQFLRSEIESGNNHWPTFYALGRALLRKGDYSEAQDVFLSYPGFHEPSSDPLGNSHAAGDAGSMFYWIGQFELAAPLLELSVISGSGSESMFSSGSRLSVLHGDFEAAQEWTAARVQRYNSKYAIRDLQQILHVRGESEIAWSIFDQAQSAKRQDPQVWSGALIGHRIQAATTNDLVDWIESSETRRNSLLRSRGPRKNMKLAPRYLLLAGTMDRLPGPELVEAIAKYRFEKKTVYFLIGELDNTGPEPVVVRRGRARVDGQTLGHDDLVAWPPDGQNAKESNQKIEPPFEMLASAMSALLREDHNKAAELFNEAAYYYYLDEYLPYYAFSASVVGRANHLRRALEARESALIKTKNDEKLDSSKRGYRFDEDLTYAVLAAFEKDHAAAISYLNKAMNNRPYIEERTIYPYYEVVDLADRLFEQTGVEAYRSFALDLSRRHTVVQPMYSWAYFVVAKYSDSSAERLDATASGLKLDPLSNRAARLPSELIEQAKAHLATNGPPYLQRTAEPENLGT